MHIYDSTMADAFPLVGVRRISPSHPSDIYTAQFYRIGDICFISLGQKQQGQE